MNSIYEKAKRGIPLEDILIIDCHAHIGYYGLMRLPDCFEEGILDSLDRLGIDIACIVASLSSIVADYRYGNDMVVEAVSKYPERFIGFTLCNPHYPEDMKNELDRCFAVKGIKGIKLYPAGHGCTPDYKSYHIAYETADERKCPVLFHTWGAGDIACIDKLAGQYPGANFIMGHAGGFDVRAMEKAIDAVNRHDNVYVDLVISNTYEGNVEWFVKEMGSKKVLFGTDVPFIDPTPNFGRIAMARISDEEKRDIFGLNMKKLLDI